ncbi:hypothetical protein HI914_02824 [Erysiphe necator]|nr:hypothetical protein HI914_02824 [Erysiphe necator]
MWKLSQDQLFFILTLLNIGRSHREIIRLQFKSENIYLEKNVIKYLKTNEPKPRLILNFDTKKYIKSCKAARSSEKRENFSTIWRALERAKPENLNDLEKCWIKDFWI